MHIMPGESLAHLLSAGLRVALGLPAVGTGVGSDASGGSSDSEEVMVVDEGGRVEYRRRPGDIHRQGDEERAGGIFKNGARGSRWGMIIRRGNDEYRIPLIGGGSRMSWQW